MTKLTEERIKALLKPFQTNTRYMSEHCAIAFARAIEAELQPDFCDKNCTWRDHHPDCERSEPVVEHNRPIIAAILPNGATASNVYEAYEQGCKSVQPVQEPVSFYIYKETAPRLNLPNVVLYALPWVYDQDPSSGFSARLKVYLAPPDQTAERFFELACRDYRERIATLEAALREAKESNSK
jgi:hypothetical protein